MKCGTSYIESKLGFDPEEKIQSKNFPPYFVSEYKGDEVTFELFQRTGFNNPIFVKEKTGLDIRVPNSSFSVTDVRNLVGGKRLLEVMNCATQLNAEMTLKDFEEFFQVRFMVVIIKYKYCLPRPGACGS